MPKNVIVKEEKERNFSVLGLIITIVLIVLISVGAFFLSRWFINSTKKNDEPPQSETKVEDQYDRLLELLNDNIGKTRLDGESFANEVTSFSFKENHFYISGYNNSTVYRYDLDLSSKGYSKIDDALDFINDNKIENAFEITLDRCKQVESTDFNNKYVTEGVKGKYHIGQLGPNQYVYATLIKEEVITLINGVTLSDTLEASYSPVTINSNNSLFKLYKYIATK